MAIVLITAGTGLFNKLAGYAEFISKVRTLLGTTIPKDTGAIDRLMDEYAADRSYGPRIVETFLNWRNYTTDVFLETMRQHALDTMVQQVMDEADYPPPIPDPVLCLQALFEEMRDTPNSVNAIATSVGASAFPYGTNVGNGTLVWSVTRPDGQTGETVYNETLLAHCWSDSKSGWMGTGANRTRPGSEIWRIRGEKGVPNPMRETWGATDYGSGADAYLTSVNPRGDYSLGTVLHNGDMEDWTGATPDRWGKTDAQSQISKTTTSGEYHDGSGGMKIAGHATGTPEFWQQFNSSSGSPYVIRAMTNYALLFYGRVSATPATGILTVSMTDGGNTILTSEYDANGFAASPTNQSKTYAMTGWTTSFVAKTDTFRLKRNIGTVRLHFKVTTALEAGINGFIDRIVLAEMDSIVPTIGPWCKVFSGTTDWAFNDNFSQAISGATSFNTFQIVLLRLFYKEMVEGNLIAPSDSAAGETVLDSLITA